MEVLEVSGYVSEEKSVIADKYLGPQAREASGLKDADVVLESTAVDVLIKYYCRESGVRNLKKHIDKVCLFVFCFRLDGCGTEYVCVDIQESCAQSHTRPG
jgi:Lon-like ATP-dependent protease